MRTKSRFPALETTGVDPVIKFGLMADLHYPRDKLASSDVTHNATAKLNEYVEFMQSQNDLAFCVDIGDMIDTVSGDGQEEAIGYLQTCSEELRKINTKIAHVMGNHDFDGHIDKSHFLDNTVMEEPYYYFDAGNFRFIVLDGNYTAEDDGASYSTTNFDWTEAWINPTQKAWLEQVLEDTDRPVVLITHHGMGEVGAAPLIGNRSDIRAVLQDSGKVLCVLSGHSHRSQHEFIGGIHYLKFNPGYSLNNAYSVIELTPEKISVTGYNEEKTYEIRFGIDTEAWTDPQPSE